jgi:hypothetical protein
MSAAEGHHQTGAFLFLPFAVDVFGRRDLRIKRANMMPVGRADYITAEVLDALGEVVRRGTLGFLCREGGWKAIDWARPGEEEPLKGVRLIDARVWYDLKLEFGDPSVDTLMIAYNAVCNAGGMSIPGKSGKSKQTMYPRSKRVSFKHNGDVLAHHITWLKIRGAAFDVDDTYWRFLTRNPLTYLARLDARKNPEEQMERLARPDLDTLMPWLGGHLARCWSRELEERWRSLERFRRLNEGMETYFNAIVKRAREEDRRDLLLPLMAFFKEHFRRDNAEEVALSEYNRLARDMRFADRDADMRTWGRAMHVGWELFEEYQEARAVHPLDREAADRVFMHAFEASGFEPVADRARALSNQLNAVIS